jgi:hypothetical protein
MSADLREALADLAHRQWSGWMVYLFAKSDLNENGSVTIPVDLVARWKRQMTTNYSELSEAEKNSDRAEADRIMAAAGIEDAKGER